MITSNISIVWLNWASSFGVNLAATAIQFVLTNTKAVASRVPRPTGLTPPSTLHQPRPILTARRAERNFPFKRARDLCTRPRWSACFSLLWNTVPFTGARSFPTRDDHNQESNLSPVPFHPALHHLTIQRFNSFNPPTLKRLNAPLLNLVFPAARPPLCYAARGMANKFYQPGGQHAAKIHALFSTTARRYDLINDLQSLGLHRRWKRRVVELAHVGPGQRALDLCCGTGDLALALARGGADVVGLDFSEPMLAVARQRLQRAQARRGNHAAQVLAASAGPAHASLLLRVQFLHGDALRLPFPDAEFHAVTVGYGLRNLSDWVAGLREMARVAKPGARLIVLDFGKPTNALWRACYFGYLRLAVPLFGRIFCGDSQAYAYILESLRDYAAQEGVAANMRALGLKDVRVFDLLAGAMSINSGVKP